MEWNSQDSQYSKYLKYYTLYPISLGKCQGKEILEAKEFLIKLISRFATAEEFPEEREIVGQLWKLYKSENPETPAELCLRCLISQYIKIQCHSLAKLYGEKHNFTVEDLLPLVLDSTDPSLNNDNHRSLTVRVMESFDGEKKSSLSVWVKILVRSDRELKRFLLEHGIEQVTDWLLLKQHSSSQLKRILSDFYNYSSSQIAQLTELLASYQKVYLAQIQAARKQINRERKQQGLRSSTTPYPAPNHQQLCSMAEHLLPVWKLSAEEVLAELQNLAQLIRNYKASCGKGITQASRGQGTTNLSVNTAEDEDILNVGDRQLLQKCLIASIHEVTEERFNYLQNKRNKRGKQFLQGLYFYHCQHVPMGEMAEKLGLNNQSQVSRLLDLKNFRADIGRRTLVQLRSQVIEIAQAYASASQLKDLEARIQDFLDQKIDNLIQEAQKESSISKNREMTSKLSRAICQYLDIRKGGK